LAGCELQWTLTIVNLAHGNCLRGGHNLRLAIAKRNDGGSCHNAGPNNTLASDAVCAITAGHGEDLNGRALLGPPAIVEVVEVAGLALVEDGRSAEGQGTIAALREASGVDGACLRGPVKLELVVGGDVASSALRILNDAVVEGGHQNAGSGASRCPLLHVE
jgi:hypothetical protein